MFKLNSRKINGACLAIGAYAFFWICNNACNLNVCCTGQQNEISCDNQLKLCNVDSLLYMSGDQSSIQSDDTTFLSTLNFNGKTVEYSNGQDNVHYNTEKKSIRICDRDAFLISGIVKGNFYSSAIKSGIPANVVSKFCNVFGSKINFKNSLKNGDTFIIVYDENNVLLYGKISSKKRSYCVYAYAKNDNKIDYIFENGCSANADSSKFFSQPISGARISSYFGPRRHPIFGVIKNHTGVDYVAAYGTPVKAAFSGKVVFAGYDAGYGKHVIILHPNGYKTKYAHLSSINVRYGQNVDKNAVIGRVGSTGISTGCHLHFEMIASNGIRVNPLRRITVAPEHKLCGAKLNHFVSYRNSVDKIVENAISKEKVFGEI